MMKSQERKTMRSRKALAAILATAMAATMLLSGTLAYFYSTFAVNEMKNTEKEVVGHDDLVRLSDGVTYNKDVYMENTGKTNVLVRIKLTEQFVLDGIDMLSEEKTPVDTITDATEVVFKPAVTAQAETNEIDTDANSYTDKSNAGAHQYFTWNLAGEGKTFLSADDPAKYYSKAGNNANGKRYMEKANDGRLNDAVVRDDSNLTYTTTDMAYIEDDVTAVREAKSCVITTMSKYYRMKEIDKRAYYGWIYDDTDGNGWFYWSQPVLPAGATGLLLNGLQMKTEGENILNADYDYRIKVYYEAVDHSDRGLWSDSDVNTPQGETTALTIEKASEKAIAAFLNLFDPDFEALPHYELTPEGERLQQEIAIKASGTKSQSAKTLYLRAVQNVRNYLNTTVTPLKQSLNKTRIEELLTMAETIEREGPALRDTMVITASTGDDGTVTYTHMPASGKTEITDQNLLKYLVETFDTNGDKALSKEEALAVYEINVGLEINSISGLNNSKELTDITSSDFPYLRILSLRKYTGTTINFSRDFATLQQFGVISDTLTSVDFANIKDEIEDIGFNGTPALTTIQNIGSAPKVRYLSLSDCTSITGISDYITTFQNADQISLLHVKAESFAGRSLDFSNSPKLEILEILGYIDAGSVNISACSNLWKLRINPAADSTVTVGDLSKNPLLKLLEIDGDVRYTNPPCAVMPIS